MNASIAVTGANGFLGSALVRHLRDEGIDTLAISRSSSASSSVSVGDIGPNTDWSVVLRGVSCVVHCAGRAHVLKETEVDPAEAFRRVNTLGSVRLVQDAVRAGVRRVVFISSIGVLGANTNRRGPFGDTDAPNPHDPYSVSKYAAETALQGIARESGLELVIVRPTLIYGPGAPANFQRLVRLVESGIPLPLGAIRNSRSLTSVGNMASLLKRCAEAPAAAGQTLLAADGVDLSTPELVREIARGLGKRPRLLPVPVRLLRLAGSATGRSSVVERLVGSLQVDTSRTRDLLGWSPPEDPFVAIAASVRPDN